MNLISKVVHCKRDKYDVYIGRPSKWGNPFTHIANRNTKAKYKVGSRHEAIAEYRNYLKTNTHLFSALPELKNKILGCWCAPKACHGDILVAYANKCISYFGGYYSFLSNFYNSKIEYRGTVYPNVESAYQAHRPTNNDLKSDIMRDLLYIKFSNPKLRKMLLETDDLVLADSSCGYNNLLSDIRESITNE